MSNSIGIIGGADGPTVIFLASSPGAGWLLLAVLIALLVIVAVCLFLRRKKK